MKKPISATALFCIFLWTLTAGPIPGRWEKVDNLPLGSEITVLLVTGEELHAAFLGSTPVSLSLRDDSGPNRERTIPKPAIELVSRKHRGSPRRGALLGAGIGYGATFGTLVATGGHASDPVAPIAALWGFAGAGVGAVLGVVAEATGKETEVLYARGVRP